VLRYFVIFCVFVFLLVTLYIDIFQYFIGPKFRVGLPVVPILLMGSLFLGVYVNLSIWYKLTDRTLLGAGVALFGALLTIALNLWWVPTIGYVGSAWAHLICYLSMTVISYLLGRRYYPVDYRMPGGLQPDELVALIRPLVRTEAMIGLSLACYNPDLDDADFTSGKIAVDILARTFSA